MKNFLLGLGPLISTAIALFIMLLLKKNNLMPDKINVYHLLLFCMPIYALFLFVVGEIFKGK